MQKTYSLKQPIIFLGLLVFMSLFVLESKATNAFSLTDTLEITLTATPTGCLNGTDGLITVDIIGGMPPYNVEVSSEMKRRTVYSSITLPGIIPGTYEVMVTDHLGDQESGMVTVDTGMAPAIADSLFTFSMMDGCLTECQGSLDINIDTLNYIFRWNGKTLLSDTLTKLCAGDHLLQVERIGEHCIVNTPVNLPEPSPEEALPQCPGDTTIQIDPDLCASVFDYGLEEWASEACGVGKDFLMTTDMVDDGYGLAGTMFDLKNISPDTLIITGWDLLLDQGEWDIQVYQTRISPTFVGNTFNGTNAATNLNWRFMGQTTVSSGGPLGSTHVPLGGIILPPNSSSGIYITSTRGWLNGPISMQESTPSAMVANCDLELSAGIGLTNRAGFGFAQGQGDLVFGNATQSGGNNNNNYRLIEANIYYVPLNKDIFQVDGTGLTNLSTFPVGSTTQAFSFLNNGNLEDAICTFTVNVEEPTPPTFTDCPTDISVVADSVDCRAMVIYDLPAFIDNCMDRELELRLNKSNDITESLRCYNQQTGESPESAHIRVFDLQNQNLVSPFLLTEVAVGVAESDGTEEVSVNIYEVHPDSALTYANMTLLQTEAFTPPAGADFSHPVAINASIQADHNLVVEMIDPENSEFIAGYTEEGNGASYFVGCGYTEPTNLVEINCIRRHFYTKVTGSSSLVLTLEQTDSTGYGSGSMFPSGTTLQEFTATDASGNTASCSFEVTVTNDLSLILEPTSTSCATNEGTITVTAEGGLEPYTYLWSTGSTEDSLADLSPGEYLLTLTDTNGCTTTAETTVEGDLAPTFTMVNILPSLCGNDNGSIEVSAEGGNGPATYEWSTGATDTIIQDLSPGFYMITVTDTLGCVTIDEFEVIETPGPSIDSLASLPSLCGNSSGSAVVVPEGANGPFTYEWSNGTTDSLAIDLGPGGYFVTVMDANGCMSNDSVFVDEIPGPDLAVTITSPTLCGGADGTAEVIPSGNGPFTYEWSTGATDSLLVDLAADTFIVVVADTNGCVTELPVIVENLLGPELTLEVVLPSGCIISDGIASVTPTGTGPYTYEWSTGSTDSLATGLLPGGYGVIVIDGNNCVSEGEVTVDMPNGPVLTAIMTPPTSCLENNGSIEVQADGVWPYQYLWNNGFIDSILVDLPADTFSVQVFDAVGCVTEVEVVLEVDTDLAISDQLVSAASCEAPNGSIGITVEGGSAPYSYDWSNGGPDTSFQQDLAADMYFVTVTDSLGCVVEESFVIDDLGVPQIDSIDAFSAYCGQATGAAEVFFSGGSGNYTIAWSNGITEPATVDLVPGEYTITITDTNNCEVSGSVTIGDETGQTAAIEMVQQPTACVGEDGALQVQIDGGIAPYSISWSNGVTDTTLIENLAPGDYSVIVTDAEGCEVFATTTLVSLNAIELDYTAASATCNNNNGSVTIDVGGGEGLIEYTWSLDSVLIESDTVLLPTLLFTGLEGGIYELVLSDTTGCEEVVLIEVVQAGVPIITPGFTPTTCGQENGTAWVEISGGTYPYTFIWENNQNDSLLTNVPAGEYALAILDANSCLSTGTVVVEDLPAPTVTASEILQGTCGLQNGQITLDVLSSTPEYTITWSTGDSTLVIDSLEAAFYSVIVTDMNGCKTTLDSMLIEDVPDTEAPEFTVCPADIEVNSCDSTIVYDNPKAIDNCDILAIEQIEGLPSGAAFPTDTTVITYLAADASGNTSNCTFIVVRIEDFAVDAVWENPSCFGLSDGTAGITISGGTEPYDILWSTGDTTETLSDLPPGQFSVTVTDQGSCEFEMVLDVEEPAPISIALDSIFMETPPCENGAIYISATGGTAPYSFVWTNLDSMTVAGDTEDLEGLLAGSYECLITDANGCEQTSANFIVQDDSCTVNTILELDVLEAALELFPNPTNGVLSIQLPLPDMDEAQFVLYDLRGMEMIRFSGQWLAERQFQLDLSTYPTGMYWLRVQAGTAVIARKIVLTR